MPWALGILWPCTGTMACLRLFSVGVRPVRAKKSTIFCHSSGSNCSVSPKASATVSLVRSSSVGPRPPEKISRSLRRRAVSTSSFRRATLSPTTCWCSTEIPSSASSRLKNWALVLTMSPKRSSVPTQMISAVIGCLLGGNFKIRASDAALPAKGMPGCPREIHSSGSSPMRMGIFSTLAAASASSSARPGMPASAASISARVGRVLGWAGVKMVQQSS